MEYFLLKFLVVVTLVAIKAWTREVGERHGRHDRDPDVLPGMRDRLGTDASRWPDEHLVPPIPYPAPEPPAVRRPDTSVMRASRRDPMARLELPERLRRIARLIGGKEVFQRSTVEGHVVWQRAGRQFYYFEKIVGHELWSVVTCRAAGGELPALQIIRRRGGLPFSSPPVADPRPIGMSEFDRRFEVRRPAAAVEPPPLGRDVAEAFLRLDEALPTPPMLQSQPDRCRVCLFGSLSEVHDAGTALDRACELIERVAGDRGRPAASDILDVLVLSTDRAATCQVCGEEVSFDPVKCDRCGTPHHRDCWSYLGKCAVYACPGERTR